MPRPLSEIIENLPEEQQEEIKACVLDLIEKMADTTIDLLKSMPPIVEVELLKSKRPLGFGEGGFG